MVYKHFFGRTPEGQAVTRFTLFNHNTMEVNLLNYGAAVHSICVPDKEGMVEDITLGCDTIADYIEAPHFGGTIGRVANRIAGAKFTLNGKEYQLAANDGGNHLHGGKRGFDRCLWQWSTEDIDNVVVFSRTAEAGEEGYPGNLHVKVTYSLREDNALRMECEATTDRPTPVNLMNHAFFNLQSSSLIPGEMNVLSHLLVLNASAIIACDSELIPTGQLLPVDDTLLDFRVSRTIASSLMREHSQIQKGKGFSLAYALDEAEEGGLSFAARLSDEISGRKMEIYTNQPSVQVYNGYFMDGTDIGKEQTRYYASAGIAIEPQGYPDAPNQPSFPSILIDETKKYRHITEYRFSLD